jgi:hypothetical protein
MFPVRLGGSMVEAFAQTQIENRKDGRALVEASTEMELGARRMEQVHRDRASRERRTQQLTSAVQSGVSAAKSVSGYAQKTSDTIAENEAVGRLEQARAADRAAGGGHRALSEVQINEEQTLGERFSDEQISAVLEGHFETAEDIQARAGVSGEEARRLAVRQLEVMGFAEGEAEALLEAKSSGEEITAEEAAEFFYANRFVPGSALHREDAAADRAKVVGNQMLDLLSTAGKGVAEGRAHRASDAEREARRVGLHASLAEDAEHTARQIRAADAQAFRGALEAITVRSDFEA